MKFRHAGERGGGHLLYVPAGGDLTHANFPPFSSRGSPNYSKGARFLTIPRRRGWEGILSKSISEFKNVFLGELSVFPSWTYFTIGGKCSIMGIIGGWEKGEETKRGKTTAAVWAICHWIMTPQFEEKRKKREKKLF